MFWYKCICLLIDSHRYDYHDKDAYDRCIQILNKCLRLIKAEKASRLNKSGSFEYIEAMFEFEIAEITYEGIMAGKLNDGDLTRQQKMGRRSLKPSSMHPNLNKKMMFICDVNDFNSFFLC